MCENGQIGAKPSSDRQFEAIYSELRALASSWYRARRPGDTLQPTALVHEAYLKVAGSPAGDRTIEPEHFRALAAKALRHALVSHLRAKGAEKRGGEWGRVTLTGLPDSGGQATGEHVDMLELDAALNELEKLEPRHAELIELRFFGGLSIEQAAAQLGVSDWTIKNDWRMARRFLYTRLSVKEGRGDA